MLQYSMTTVQLQTGHGPTIPLYSNEIGGKFGVHTVFCIYDALAKSYYKKAAQLQVVYFFQKPQSHNGHRPQTV